MMNDDCEILDEIFGLMDRWRHLPFYRLEPRVAPYFALFLRDILETKFDVDIHPTIIPEFPLRLGSLGILKQDRKGSNDQSVKVDYAAFSLDLQTVYLVELKTDDGSFDETQYRNLCAAKATGLHCLLSGILKICRKSNKKRKYVHLLHMLRELSLITNLDKVYDYTFTRKTGCKQGWTREIGNVRVSDSIPSRPSIVVVYITPTMEICRKNDLKSIEFCEVAKIVENRGRLGETFAKYIRKWTEPAGATRPVSSGGVGNQGMPRQ